MPHSLYTDGCHFQYLKAAGIGGYLLDEQGNRLWQFSEELSDDKFLEKHENYALEHGLKKCIESGVKSLKCFTDSKSSVEILNLKDKKQLDFYVSRDSSLAPIVKLITQFDDISFHFIPRNQNKSADILSRKKVLKNHPEKTQLVECGLQIPNLLCTQQYSLKEKPEFTDLKWQIKNHYLFHFMQAENKLEVYEMVKFPEIQIVNKISYPLEKNWIKQYIGILNNTLKNSPHPEVGIIFEPNANDVSKTLRGLVPISKKAKSGLEKFEDITEKFSKVVIHDDRDFLKLVVPHRFGGEQPPLSTEQQEELLIENLKVLCEPEYKLGSNLRVEKFFALPKDKMEDLSEIQKKYFGELVKLDVKKHMEQLKLNDKPISRASKGNAMERIAKIRQGLEEKGIKLKF